MTLALLPHDAIYVFAALFVLLVIGLVIWAVHDDDELWPK